MSTKAVSKSHQDDATFMDPTFPHSSLSIGEIPDSCNLSQTNIVWLRPKDIAMHDDDRGNDWSVFNDPCPDDVMQSKHLGNCWMMAELSALAQRREILDRIMLKKHFSSGGWYKIRLCIGGRWKVITVDDYFPCHRNTRQMIFANARRKQLWVPLIEKALAKALGSYFSLYGAPLKGNPSQYDLHCFFSGAPCLTIELYPYYSDRLPACHAMQISCAELKQKLMKAHHSNFPMTAWTVPENCAVTEDEFDEAGLCSQHVYSILDIQKSNDRWLIQLRNPWGKPTGNGPWIHDWCGWTHDVRSQLEPSSTGTFWMPFEDFAYFFCGVRIAQVREYSAHST